jgi:hypothetical protein
VSLSVGKGVIGVLSHSSALIADAVHSLSDLVNSTSKKKISHSINQLTNMNTVQRRNNLVGS